MVRKLFLLVAIGAVTASCGSDAPKEMPAEQPAIEESTEETSSESSGGEINALADFKFHTMIANLPSPLQTFQIISGVDIEMMQVELTPTSMAGKLSTSSARAYGYGVYMTDMGFLAYEHQNQQTLEYFQVCRKLAEDLGAGDVFDQTISANFEENTSSEEKFVRMMDEAFNAMDQYMVDNERFVNATEIFVGSWVESQVIATRLLKGQDLSESNRAIYEGIYGQKKHASNLMNVLGEIDAEIDEDVFVAVEDIMMFYAGFSNVEGITQNDLTELESKLITLKNLLLA